MPPGNAPLLLITATAAEAEPLRKARQWFDRPSDYGSIYRAEPDAGNAALYLAHFGVGKVNTAAGLALAISSLAVHHVVQFGIGGAYPGGGLSICDLAVAQHDIHIDTGVKTQLGWEPMNELGLPLAGGERPLYNLMPTDQPLSHALVDATGAPLRVFATAETVTGDSVEAAAIARRFGVAVESMEGAAAAQVCHVMGVRFAQVRAISNVVGDRKKEAWRIQDATKVVNGAMLRFLQRYEGKLPAMD